MWLCPDKMITRVHISKTLKKSRIPMKETAVLIIWVSFRYLKAVDLQETMNKTSKWLVRKEVDHSEYSLLRGTHLGDILPRSTESAPLRFSSQSQGEEVLFQVLNGRDWSSQCTGSTSRFPYAFPQHFQGAAEEDTCKEMLHNIKAPYCPDRFGF